MAENSGMKQSLASLAQTKASLAQANATMAMSKALANANMGKQKTNVMQGEIKKATAK